MRQSHRQKVKLARKMRSMYDIRFNVPIFETEAWEKRKEHKRLKVFTRNDIARQIKEGQNA